MVTSVGFNTIQVPIRSAISRPVNNSVSASGIRFGNDDTPLYLTGPERKHVGRILTWIFGTILALAAGTWISGAGQSNSKQTANPASEPPAAWPGP